MGLFIGVLFGCFGRNIDGDPWFTGLPGGLIIYQGHLFALKGHLLACFLKMVSPLFVDRERPTKAHQLSCSTV